MTTNDDQYVPSDEDMRWHYAVKRMDDGATRTHAEREYTRWLAAHDARVRRDAAREALDGFKAWRGTRQCPATSPPGPCNRPAGHTEPHAYNIPEGECNWEKFDWEDTDSYRDTHYPEETP